MCRAEQAPARPQNHHNRSSITQCSYAPFSFRFVGVVTRAHLIFRGAPIVKSRTSAAPTENSYSTTFAGDLRAQAHVGRGRSFPHGLPREVPRRGGNRPQG